MEQTKEFRFIVSSKSMYRHLTEYLWNNWDDKGDTILTISNNKLMFNRSEISLDCECKGEGVFTVDRDDIKRLRKICKALCEQPISLHYNGRFNFIDRPLI